MSTNILRPIFVPFYFKSHNPDSPSNLIFNPRKRDLGWPDPKLRSTRWRINIRESINVIERDSELRKGVFTLIIIIIIGVSNRIDRDQKSFKGYVSCP